MSLEKTIDVPAILPENILNTSGGHSGCVFTQSTENFNLPVPLMENMLQEMKASALGVLH